MYFQKNTKGNRSTPKTSSSRIFVITLILVAVAAITVDANWGSGFGYGLFASDEVVRSAENATEPADPLMVPPTVGAYPNTSIALGVNTTITPSTAPMNLVRTGFVHSLGDHNDH